MRGARPATRQQYKEPENDEWHEDTWDWKEKMQKKLHPENEVPLDLSDPKAFVAKWRNRRPAGLQVCFRGAWGGAQRSRTFHGPLSSGASAADDVCDAQAGRCAQEAGAGGTRAQVEV